MKFFNKIPIKIHIQNRYAHLLLPQILFKSSFAHEG
jgi:hypothetical protein